MTVWSAARLFAGDDPTSAAHRAEDWATTPLGPVEGWSAELLAAIRTVMPSRVAMLLWWGPELVQIFNDAYAQVLGDKYPAAIGQPGAECWSEVWDEIGPPAAGVLAGEAATYSEKRLLFLRRHGYLEETYWTFSYSPVIAGDGTVAGVFVATTDVTARVLSERRLETLRQLGTLSMTAADSAADACRAAVAVLGTSSADLPMVAAYLDSGSDGIVRVARTGANVDLNLDVVRRVAATGTAERVGDVVVLPLSSAARGRLGVLAVGLSPYREYDASYASFVDLVAAGVDTALGDATAYAAERERARALAELDTAKTRFLQNISHEFRTPLALLLAPLGQLAEQNALDPGQRETLRAAHRAAQRLQRLVDALLDVTVAEADHLHVHREPTDVAALTLECAEMFRSAAEAAGLEFAVDVACDGTVELDQDMWARIVLNLVSNALKFTPRGSVTVRQHVADQDVAVEVADVRREGAGIGLALVADLARALGGAVRMTSEPGTGSVFTVTVPRIVSDQPPAQALTHDLGTAFLHETRRWAPHPAPDRTGDARVLLVEDNADMRDYLVRLLEAQRWRPEPVGDAATALERARTAPPDLVLSDVMLPGEDGLMLLRKLRADPRLARVPVVLLTARAGAESAVEGLHLGADDYVVKPFHPAELIARVRVHLELSRFRESLITKSEREVSTIRGALDTRTTIGQAVGILMVVNRCDADTAFQQIVTMSQNSNRKLRDVAAELVRAYVGSEP